MSGGSLFTYINNHKLKKSQIKFIFTQIVSAIEYIHSSRYLLRDLKPENILINKKTLRVYLCDFGWSCSQNDYDYLMTKAGTYAYMSPE